MKEEITYFYSKTGSENVQLVFQLKKLRFFPPTFKLLAQQISSPQVSLILTSDWVKLRGSHVLHRSYVSCCKTSLPWVSKTRNMYRICCKK